MSDMDFFGGNDDGVLIQDENHNDHNNNINHGYANFDKGGTTGGNFNMQGGFNLGGGIDNNFAFSGEQDDPEERQRNQDRQNEENAKREKLFKKMNAETELKQETRNKALEWVDNQNKLYQKNVSNRREFNKNNETDFLNNRQNIKAGNANPWEVVINNIDTRDSDYKGSKDVSRMRAVIITRKGDFSNMKMK